MRSASGFDTQVPFDGRRQFASMSGRRLERPTCTDLAVAERREWLVTNGRGSYAMGTVAGTLTRCYHGLLVAALVPPVGRRMIVPAVNVSAVYRDVTYPLATNCWASGARAPDGWCRVASFAIAGGVPVWTYAFADVRIETVYAMPDGRDETALLVRVLHASAPVDLTFSVLVADRDHHGGDLPDPAGFAVTVNGDRATVALPVSHRALHVTAPGAVLTAAADRWSGFFFEREAERGLPALGDYLHALDARMTLSGGAAGGLVIGLAAASESAAEIVAAAQARGAALAAAAPNALAGDLSIAAEQFLVAARPAGPERATVIAGFPWFSDWGRDTMIALPGLTLARGRPDVAAAILRSFAPYISLGMLPNVFPDAGAAPEYNTVDAALWYIVAIGATLKVRPDDLTLADDLLPAIRTIVKHYTRGTRYGIRIDDDGLLSAGEDGVQLTWMDAKAGGRVITPRIGKPVEINALWYASLLVARDVAALCAEDSEDFEQAAERARESFGRFWNDAAGCCFDVIDGPHGNDPALRPNQLFAIALAPELLGPQRSRAVVDACVHALLTPVGLRTLAPSDPAYVGHYGGDQATRDAAYHQGTVWPWLIGPFVRAHLNAYGDPSALRLLLAPMADALDGYGVGTLGEIFDGDAPHAPAGTIAQAWSVAEFITALDALDRYAAESA
jgi:glycogen debranching enzyme